MATPRFNWEVFYISQTSVLKRITNPYGNNQVNIKKGEQASVKMNFLEPRIVSTCSPHLWNGMDSLRRCVRLVRCLVHIICMHLLGWYALWRSISRRIIVKLIFMLNQFYAYSHWHQFQLQYTLHLVTYWQVSSRLQPLLLQNSFLQPLLVRNCLPGSLLLWSCLHRPLVLWSSQTVWEQWKFWSCPHLFLVSVLFC